MPKQLNPKILSRFWKYIQKTEDCWLWIGNRTKAGYGLLFFNPVVGKVYAHRFSWELRNGDIPKGVDILHKCDRPACVNPDHLFLGTAKSNAMDMARKHRAPSTKLSEDDVKYIREHWTGAVGFKGDGNTRRLAEMFGVHRTTIYFVASGRHYPPTS